MAAIKRTRVNLMTSRLWMITASQPTNAKSITSSRTPNINLKKASSFLKKAFPRKIPFIKKYMMEATIPIAGDEKAFKFI